MGTHDPRLVPETEVTPLRQALRALLEATPAGPGLKAAVRAQAEKALAAYDSRPDLKTWVLTYDHRHGQDVSVVLSVHEPDGEAFYEDIGAPEDDESITIQSPAVSVLEPDVERGPRPALILEDQVGALGTLVRDRDWPAALATLRALDHEIALRQQERRVEHVRGPRDGNWWQLYTSSPDLKAEVQAATRDLNAALDKALAQIASESREDLARGLGLDPATARGWELSNRLLHRHLNPVMSRHAAAGAADSEPRDAALDALEDALAQRDHGMEAFPRASSAPARSR